VPRNIIFLYIMHVSDKLLFQGAVGAFLVYISNSDSLFAYLFYSLMVVQPAKVL
jgi:hypothetical protein